MKHFVLLSYGGKSKYREQTTCGICKEFCHLTNAPTSFR